jgi:predicted kinase
MKATILIGLPMSGKSTYAKANKGSAVIIDCDYLRMMLTGEDDKYKAFNRDNEFMVWETFYGIISDCKYSNKDIIIANTNCNLSKLRLLIDMFKGWEIEFIIIDTTKSVCISRLPSDAQYMAEIIDKMEEKMRVTCDWLREAGMNVKIIS